MPQSRRSLLLTDAYRDRLALIGQTVERTARQAWPRIEELDSTPWPEFVADRLTRAQTQAARLSAAYLGAYLRSEGASGTAPAIDSRAYAGKSRDGRPLTESLPSALVGVRAKLKQGAPPSVALDYGLHRATRMVEVDFMHAARESLRQAMEDDPRIEGWQRAVRGTCGACLGDIAVEVSVQLPSLPLNVHPNCQCVTQPVVAGVPQTVGMLTGTERFARMSPEEQDEQFGPEKAQALREDRISLADLVETSPLATADDFITEKPLEAVST